MKTKFLLLLVLVFTLTFANDKIEQIDSIFSDYNSKTPSISVAIIQDGNIILKKAYGMASLELKVPATTKSLYRIGSLSKQITAAGILILEQQGKLSVKDKVIEYFPQLPKSVYGEITIEQMLFHTSGIRDAEAMYPLMGIAYSQWFTHDMMLEMLARQKSLCFPASNEYEYSNSAYTLLALIIEKVTGEKFTSFIQQNIFDPLNMKNSYIQSSPETFIPNRTAGYKQVNGKYVNWMTNNQLLGHDAVYSSVEDLFFWQQALQKGKIGTYNLEIMKIPGKFNSGSSGNYGYGLVMGKYHGLDYYCHDGWYVGYKAFIITFPQEDFAVIAINNLGNRSTRPKALKLVDLFLKDKFVKNSSVLLKDNETFKTIAQQDSLVRLRLGGFKQVKSLKNYVKSPYSKNEYCSPDHQVRIRFDDGKLIQETSYGSENVYVPFNYSPINQLEKQQLIGKYFSEELDNSASIFEKKGQLFLQIGLTEFKLFKFRKDQFVTEESFITIIKKNRKNVKKFNFSTYGVQHIIFEKIK